MTTIESVAGNTGYRHQLDRARRILERVEPMSMTEWDAAADGVADDVEFQDMMWAFFQNCWHVKDWLRNDPSVPAAVKKSAIELLHNEAGPLKICHELCNGTKHLGQRSGASHRRVDLEIVPGWGITSAWNALSMMVTGTSFPASILRDNASRSGNASLAQWGWRSHG